MPKVTIHFPDELLEDIEKEVDESLIHEDRSQFVRTACRTLLHEQDNEFREAN